MRYLLLLHSLHRSLSGSLRRLFSGCFDLLLCSCVCLAVSVSSLCVFCLAPRCLFSVCLCFAFSLSLLCSLLSACLFSVSSLSSLSLLCLLSACLCLSPLCLSLLCLFLVCLFCVSSLSVSSLSVSSVRLFSTRPCLVSVSVDGGLAVPFLFKIALPHSVCLSLQDCCLPVCVSRLHCLSFSICTCLSGVSQNKND